MALIMYVLFLVICIIGRVILQYRITGDHGLRPITETSSMLAKLSSVLLLLTFISTLLLSILDALNSIEPQIELGIVSTVFGILFCSIGIIVTFVSQYQMGAAWRIGVNEEEKTDLIDNGLYSYVRNPIYIGVMFFGIGLLFFVPHTYMLIGLFLGYVSIDLHVRCIEEPFLTKLHGSIFEKYKMRVNRYIPKLVTKPSNKS